MYEVSPVFYVDDDIDDLNLFLEVATLLHVPAKLFSRGDKLLKALLNPPPTPLIIFIDLNMPLLSGYDVIREIKENKELSQIPLVVLSTGSDAGNIMKCHDTGADYYIQKPSSMQVFKKALMHVMSIEWKQHDSEKNFLYSDS